MGSASRPLPQFATQRCRLQLSDALSDAETDLWLLTHPEARHLRRVATTYAHLAQVIQL
jgi:hypothetical protein